MIELEKLTDKEITEIKNIIQTTDGGVELLETNPGLTEAIDAFPDLELLMTDVNIMVREVILDVICEAKGLPFGSFDELDGKTGTFGN